MDSIFKINTGEKKKLIKYWIVKNDPLNIKDKIAISGTIGLTILKGDKSNKLVE